jgi:hypothetical protein
VVIYSISSPDLIFLAVAVEMAAGARNAALHRVAHVAEPAVRVAIAAAVPAHRHHVEVVVHHFPALQRIRTVLVAVASAQQHGPLRRRALKGHNHFSNGRGEGTLGLKYGITDMLNFLVPLLKIVDFL